MNRYRGLTWDHPRGRVWLEAASVLWRERGIDIDWEVHSLEGFEAHPIGTLAEQYDLIVLDHPHIGDAVEAGCLQPIESVLGAEHPALARVYAGRSLRSYRWAGSTWALPIDAAAQVSARDATRVDAEPETWSDVERLAREVPVALSVSGPHALLSFFSAAAALGAEPVDAPGESWVPDREARDALDLLRAVHAHAAPGYDRLNPIALLEHLASDDPLAYVPLVYGYVNFATRGSGAPVAFGEAPRIAPGARIGSTIGGTGVAISGRTRVTEALRDYLDWLVAPRTQRAVIPEFDGQPALAAAWNDAEVDAAAGAFYSSTRDTIESAYLRPRYAGYPDAQIAGSAIVRAALAGDLDSDDAIGRLGALARESRRHVPEGTR